MLNTKVIDFNKYKEKTNSYNFIENNLSPRKKLYILIGIPGSGKSYYAENNLNHSKNKIISTDNIRKEIYGTFSFSLNNNDLIIKTAKNRIEQSLIQNYNVVYDATNTNKINRQSIVNIGKKCNALIIGIVFKTPLSICIKRNRLRCSEKKVPEDKLILMSRFNSNINKLEEGFDSIIYIQ